MKLSPPQVCWNNQIIDTTVKGIYIELPKADFKLFSSLAAKMGWSVKTKKNILDSFVATRPTKANLSDEEIMEELTAVRYKK